jgi:hypothetical protein
VVGTGDAAHNFGPPRADKPSHTKDLAARDGEVDVGEDILAAEAADRQHDVLGVRLRGVVLELEIAADHRADQLLLRHVAGLPNLDQLPSRRQTICEQTSRTSSDGARYR